MRDDARTDFQSIVPLYGAYFPGLTAAYNDSTIDQTKTTQEVRLVSQSNGPWQWLVGFFQDRLDYEQNSDGNLVFGSTA
jgi:hypothetical protein